MFSEKIVQYSITFHYRLKHYESHSMQPYSLWACQWYQKCDKKHLGLGDLNVTNKPHSFIDVDDMPFMLFFLLSYLYGNFDSLIIFSCKENLKNFFTPTS
jgi:hypothetical protein